MTTDKRIEKIYLTYKTRMLSAALAKSHARFYSALIPWYSFLLIAFSVAQGFGFYSDDSISLLVTVASVGIFGLSLYINGHQLWQRAEDYKSCYLKLTEVYEGKQDTDEKMSSYNKILALYENQSDGDYDEMVFDAWLRGQELQNSKGVVVPSWFTAPRVILRKIARFATRIGLTIAPIVLARYSLGSPEQLETNGDREVGSAGEPVDSAAR